MVSPKFHLHVQNFCDYPAIYTHITIFKHHLFTEIYSVLLARSSATVYITLDSYNLSSSLT